VTADHVVPLSGIPPLLVQLTVRPAREAA